MWRFVAAVPCSSCKWGWRRWCRRRTASRRFVEPGLWRSYSTRPEGGSRSQSDHLISQKQNGQKKRDSRCSSLELYTSPRLWTSTSGSETQRGFRGSCCVTYKRNTVKDRTQWKLCQNRNSFINTFTAAFTNSNSLWWCDQRCRSGLSGDFLIQRRR